MQDIINTGWDAKHSFEDEIQPVWQAKVKYGSHLAILGGFDVNKLSLMNECEIRGHKNFAKRRKIWLRN